MDYRRVNEVTRRNAYPLPHINTTLDTLAGAQWFTTLDLLGRCWHVEIKEADREKAAYYTTKGVFQFLVIPFGLCNAPAAFQCLIYNQGCISISCFTIWIVQCPSSIPVSDEPCSCWPSMVLLPCISWRHDCFWAYFWRPPLKVRSSLSTSS